MHGPDGHATFEVLPRFPQPGRGETAGSLVAPMPGAVLRVAVIPGATVAAGQVLVVIEAMKMEHQIVAPDDGQVAEVMVAPGDQVEAGAGPLEVRPPNDDPGGADRELLGLLR